MSDMLAIHWQKGTFGQAQVVDGIQEIGFTGPVFTEKAIDLRVELQLLPLVIFELDQR